MIDNFNYRISVRFHSHPAAYREGYHRENVSEVNAKHNRNVFRQFVGYNSFDNIRAHLAAIIKSAEHNTCYYFLRHKPAAMTENYGQVHK